MTKEKNIKPGGLKPSLSRSRKSTSKSKRSRQVPAPELVALGWGIYCEAALRYGPGREPCYIVATKKAAEAEKRQMDKECASEARHFVERVYGAKRHD